MRTTTDRIRHTILFEVFGLALCIPLASLILDRSISQVGSLSITLSLIAMGLNYLFNLCFDRALVWFGKPVNIRSLKLRILHAVFYEISLLIPTVPIIAFWLDMGVWSAFLTDAGFVIFFLIYAFMYNWIYDLVFPMPITN